MSKARWSQEDFKKAGLINVNGVYKTAKSQVAKKVGKIKLPPDYVSFKNVGIVYSDGRTDPVIKPNAKIKNATKSINSDGVKFDSQLERYMYERLKAAGIDFEFQVGYVLQEKFRYGTEAVRGITLTVDFRLPGHNMLIDTKGFKTQQGTMRWKMLKHLLRNKLAEEQMLQFEPIDSSKLPSIEQPKNKKECDLLINRLLFDK